MNGGMEELVDMLEGPQRLSPHQLQLAIELYDTWSRDNATIRYGHLEGQKRMTCDEFGAFVMQRWPMCTQWEVEGLVQHVGSHGIVTRGQFLRFVEEFAVADPLGMRSEISRFENMHYVYDD